jgi:hypothetical protein
MGRRIQQYEGKDLPQVIRTLAQVAELADEIEEGEKRKEADQDEAGRAVDLAREVALEGARTQATCRGAGE